MRNNGFTRRSFVRLSGLAAASLGLAACGGGTQGVGAPPADAIRIGGIGPLTGSSAIYGTATRIGAQIAVDKINETEGKTVLVLNWEDDQHDTEKAINAYNILKDWGMHMLVGCTTTPPCKVVSTETNADRIFQLTPSASSTDVLGGQADANGNVTIPRKDNVFQMCFSDPNQGTASATFIANRKLGSKIAVIYNNSDPYSTGIFQKFDAKAKELGLDVVKVSSFTDDSSNDLKVQLGEAKGAGADLVFIPIYYTPAALLLTQAHEIGYAPKFFGVDGLDGILSIPGFDTSLAEGVMLLTPFVATANDEGTKNFVAAYREYVGSNEDPNQFAADAFDCVSALYKAIKELNLKADMSAQDMCDKLIETFSSGKFTYSGLTGANMTWSATGEVSKDPKGTIIKKGVYQPL